MASRHVTIEVETEKLLEPIAEANGVWIYDVEYVKEGADYYLRAFIEKEGGVNILDCENVSRALSDALDEVDMIPEAYILEVSSPGLGRKLTKDRHLDQAIGEEVEIKLYKPIDDSKQKEYAGELIGYDATSITIAIGAEADDIKEQKFDRSAISQIRLAFDF